MNGFCSILFTQDEQGPKKRQLQRGMPAHFSDLQLDYITNAICSPKDEYNLKPFYHHPLQDPASILYRQEVMRDIEKQMYLPLQNFAMAMCEVRRHIIKFLKLYYKHQQEKWFLDGVEIYCCAVETLYEELHSRNLLSEGFRGLTAYLAGYLQSVAFTGLKAQTIELQKSLAAIRYCIHIDGLRVEVTHPETTTDYSNEIETVFAKFKENAAKNYLIKFTETEEMNSVEAKILDGVAWLHPAIFSALNAFCEQNLNFQDTTIECFDREVQFYMAYADYTKKIKEAGYRFCYPETATSDKHIRATQTFDLALTKRNVGENIPVVLNDFELSGNERILVVSGPNQGGKTTFARTFGQMHYLASLGLPVPGKNARLMLPDHIFTHFEKEEDITNLRGKLQDDLIRIHEILQQASSKSIVVLNEVFNSTTLYDQIFLSRQIMKALMDKDIAGIWVTFIGELSVYSEQTVSMVSSIVPDNPVMRTYKIERGPANDLIYALSIAEKYGLTYYSINQRLKNEALTTI